MSLFTQMLSQMMTPSAKKLFPPWQGSQWNGENEFLEEEKSENCDLTCTATKLLYQIASENNYL